MSAKTRLTINNPITNTNTIIDDYAKWETAKLIFQTNEDSFNYIAEIRDIIILSPAANIFINPDAFFFNVTLTVYEGTNTIDFYGVISLEDIEFLEKDLCKISIRLDSLDLLLSKISSYLVRATHKTLVLREPQKDASATGIIALFVALVFALVSLAYTFVNIRLTSIAIISTGLGAPGGSAYIAIAYILLFLYLVIFIISLIRAIRELKAYLNAVRVDANCYNLYDCMVQIANAAGYNLDTQSIQDVRDVYIVTPPHVLKGGTTDKGYELITAAEIIDAVKKTLNARIFVFNNTISFVPIQSTNIPPQYYDANIERFSYDTSELHNIFVFSLTRDAAEGYSYLATAAAFERIIPKALGYKKIQLPYSPHRVKAFETFLDRAVQGLLLTIFIITVGLGFIVFLILRALGVLKDYDPKRGHIIVEGEGWNSKIIKTDNIEKPGLASEERYIRSVANQYRARLLRVYKTKVKLTFTDLYNIMLQGFPSTRALTYYVLDEYAEVEFVEEVNANINPVERFV
ncbi:MAG: hypothetical protein ACK4NC_07395 [Candidatus Gracilibacteria bacterium]